MDKYKIIGTFNSCLDSKVPEPINPSIIVSNCHTTHIPFIEKLENKKLNFGVIQQSDETLGESFSYIHFERCKFVARGYTHPHTRFCENLFTFGLGYKKGFTEKFNFLPFNQRELWWGFAGEIREDLVHKHIDRSKAISLFKQIEPNFFYHTHGFFHPNRYNAEQYRKLMDRSKFSLCPYGHTNNDTHRLYESLEAGCIPVVIKNAPPLLSAQYLPSYWHTVFRTQQKDNVIPFLIPITKEENIWQTTGLIEDMPFIIGDNWEECLEKVKYIINNDKGEEVQKQCIIFWKKWKNYWSLLFERNIAKLYE